MEHVSISDWMALAIGVVGFVAALLARCGRLPPNVRKWLKAIGEGRVLSLIEIAAADLTDKKTKQEKRDWVAGQIKAIVYNNKGLRLPDSIANLIVEYGYAIYKRTTKRK